MGGVELAPPGRRPALGRRVCAAAVERGVLLRPLGDVVVLMPPLTVTSPELHRIVHALAGALDEVSATWRESRRLGSDWADAARPKRASRRRRPSGAAPPRPRSRPGPEGRAGRPSTTAPVVSFASNDYLGLTQHPAVRRAAHAALDRWGTGAGVGAPDRRLAAGALRARGRSSRRGSTRERAVLFTTGFAANLGVLTTFAGPTCSCAPTS